MGSTTFPSFALSVGIRSRTAHPRRRGKCRETLRDTLKRLLQARFGTIKSAVENRIGSASSDELDRWIARVIVVDRVDDVFIE